MAKLEGKKVAVLVTKGFEEVELTKPVEALKEAGADPVIVSPEQNFRSWDKTDWGSEFTADVMLDDADPKDYDALVLPGGVMNPDYLRMNDDAVSFVRYFMQKEKPVGAICHGPWTLVEADVVSDRRITSYPSVKTDLKNAGANWVDEEVVVDGNLTTSRNPGDIPAFNRTIVEEFAGKVEA